MLPVMIRGTTFVNSTRIYFWNTQYLICWDLFSIMQTTDDEYLCIESTCSEVWSVNMIHDVYSMEPLWSIRTISVSRSLLELVFFRRMPLGHIKSFIYIAVIYVKVSFLYTSKFPTFCMFFWYKKWTARCVTKGGKNSDYLHLFAYGSWLVNLPPWEIKP